MSKKVDMTEQQMRETCQRLSNKLRVIEKKKWIEENQVKVGSCWKFYNSYSGSKNWWVYARVKKIVYLLGGSFCTFQFEIDCNGQITTQICTHTFLSGWQPCSQGEYLRAWQRVKQRITKVQP